MDDPKNLAALESLKVYMEASLEHTVSSMKYALWYIIAI